MQNRNVAVGVFVLAGLGLFTLVIFAIGNERSFFSRHADLYTEFANVDGLVRGTEVEVDGFHAGELTDIQLPNSPSGRFRLTLRIDRRLKPLVKSDSVVTIGTEGIVGDKFLEIQSGSAGAAEATPSTTLTSKEPLSMADLFEKTSALIDGASGTINGVEEKLFRTLDAVTKTVNSANDVITSVKEGKGTVGMLLQDETVAANIRQAITNAKQATVALKHASDQVDAFVTDLQSRGLGGKVDQTMLSVRSAARNIDTTSQEVRRTVTEAVAPDDQGLPAGENIRQALSNVNRATGNMATDTEALKHEFFFRGFFKHRGYYSLANLNPATYRSTRLFANPANPRVWLGAANLFERRQGGGECLSATGKAQIDAAVAGLGDGAVNGPLVIEGYSSTGASETQLLASHDRALMVRNYILSRYQINLQNLGVVPLRSLPPPSVHRETWDGVCIVMLRARSG